MEYMPIFWIKAIETFFVYKLEGDALAKVIEFCGGLRNQMSRDSFMLNTTLFNMGHKFLIWIITFNLLILLMLF